MWSPQIYLKINSNFCNRLYLLPSLALRKIMPYFQLIPPLSSFKDVSMTTIFFVLKEDNIENKLTAY